MPLSDSQKRIIKDNITRLDLMNGAETLSGSKNMGKNELYLIISLGGFGGQVLRMIKQMVVQQFDEKDVESHLMFLCCDTNHLQLEQMENELTPDEILKVPFYDAKSVIDPAKMSPATAEWVHPGLYDYTNSKSGFFDGTGASALRQCGRVMFAQSETQNRLKARLKGIYQKAAKMTDAGINEPKLKVIFLAGIAGGTGSGAIVDLGFLT